MSISRAWFLKYCNPIVERHSGSNIIGIELSKLGKLMVKINTLQFSSQSTYHFRASDDAHYNEIECVYVCAHASICIILFVDFHSIQFF